MLAKSKRQLDVSLEKEVKLDFDQIRDFSNEQRMNSAFRIISNLIKAAIGKSHEYTIEESLFILNEEFKLQDEQYDKLKRILLHFSYFKYSNVKRIISNDTLDEFENDIINIIKFIIPPEKEEEALKIYNLEKEKKPTILEDGKIHLQLKKHKKNLLDTEKQILMEIEQETESKPKEIKPPIKLTDEITKKETLEQNDKLIKEKEFKEKFEFKNIYSTVELKEEEELSKLIQDAPTFIPELQIKETKFNINDIKIPFNEIFENTTEFKIDKIINYEFDDKQNNSKGIDLHIKYHLLKGNSPNKIKKHYQNKISTEILDKLISNNNNYINKTKKLSNIRSIQEIIIVMTLSLIFGKNLDTEAHKLEKKGFQPDEVKYVLENIIQSF